jgi:hypothetical protein
MASEEQQLAQARARFADFHGRAPRYGEIIAIEGLTVPTLGLAIGHMTAIGYHAAGTGKFFSHDFSSARRPVLFVNSDGRQVYILKGGYRFTERGFIG